MRNHYVLGPDRQRGEIDLRSISFGGIDVAEIIQTFR